MEKVITPAMRKRYLDYLDSDAWKLMRLRRKHFDHDRCIVCGKSIADDEAWHCHHLTYSRLYHEKMDDLVTLCPECHSKAHELENMRKHTTTKNVIDTGLNYILDSRRKNNGIKGLLELRSTKGRAVFWQEDKPYMRAGGWQVAADALEALFAKAFEHDTPYGITTHFFEVGRDFHSIVCREILATVPNYEANKKQCAQRLGITTNQLNKIIEVANLR